MIGIIDYGVNNLSSVKNSVESLGFDVQIFQNPKLISEFSHVILPGIGSFNSGMNYLTNGGWVTKINEFVKSGRPLLGICLGMQLLFDFGFEFGKTKGLGLISGKVVSFKSISVFKTPHVGWNSLIEIKNHPVLKNIKSDVDMYFVHSFHCIPRSKDNILAYSNYEKNFVSIVGRNNIIGTQFHPEKSQPAGKKILKNFLIWNGQC